MKKYLSLIFLLFIFLINPCFPQDQIVNARNVNVQITNPNATGGGAGAVPWNSINVTYVLAPLGPDNGFCISIVNNNPTSAHSFSVNAFQTGDSQVNDFTHNTGRYAPLAIINNAASVPAGSTSTFYIKSNGASKLALQFSGATTQAGNPDTVDIYAVQTTAGGCGNISGTSDASAQGYYVFASTSNPVIGQQILHVNDNTGSKSLYWKKVSISCSAACNPNINQTTSLGITCTAGNPAATQKNGATNLTSVTIITTNCTTNPNFAVNIPYQVQIPANTTQVFDVTNFIASGGTTNGLDVNMQTALTGTIAVTIMWDEK